MKKIALGTIIISISMILVGCNKPATLNNENEINKEVTINNKNEINRKVTIDQAKEIALKHANLTSDQVKFIKTETDIDNGVEKYDIEFYHENKEYDYEINTSSGEIMSYDYDVENYNIPIKQETNRAEGKITVEQAKEIALKHANLTSNQVTFKKVELDFDDGIQKYEVEFYFNNKEYSYEIGANTGEILSYEQD